MSTTHHYHEDRPWGSFDQFTHNTPSTVKILNVSANKRLSLQKHKLRGEFWHVVSGNGVITIDTKEYNAQQGDEFEISVGMVHRIAGGSEGMQILEISTGKFDEGDIIRIEDDFNRVTTS